MENLGLGNRTDPETRRVETAASELREDEELGIGNR